MSKPTRPMPSFVLGSSKPKPLAKGGPLSPPKAAQEQPPVTSPPVDARNPRPRPIPPVHQRTGPKPKLRVTRAKDGSYQIESTATGEWAPAIVGLDKQYAENMLARTQH